MKNFTIATRVCFMLASLLVSIAFAATQEQIVQVKPDGDWRGSLDAAGTKLDLVLHISSKDGALSATLDKRPKSSKRLR